MKTSGHFGGQAKLRVNAQRQRGQPPLPAWRRDAPWCRESATRCCGDLTATPSEVDRHRLVSGPRSIGSRIAGPNSRLIEREPSRSDGTRHVVFAHSVDENVRVYTPSDTGAKLFSGHIDERRVEGGCTQRSAVSNASPIF